MIQRLIGLYMNYKEVIHYLIFGGLTTLVNFIVYFTVKWVGIEEWISNAMAWVIAVAFAYITNKIFVFESKTTEKKETKSSTKKEEVKEDLSKLTVAELKK